MKRLIKIIKPAEREVTGGTEASSASTSEQRRTEMTVRSWIIESRERRHDAASQPQGAVRRKIGGAARG